MWKSGKKCEFRLDAKIGALLVAALVFIVPAISVDDHVELTPNDRLILTPFFFFLFLIFNLFLI
jgi:hypothetical protein